MCETAASLSQIQVRGEQNDRTLRGIPLRQHGLDESQFVLRDLAERSILHLRDLSAGSLDLNRRRSRHLRALRGKYAPEKCLGMERRRHRSELDFEIEQGVSEIPSLLLKRHERRCVEGRLEDARCPRSAGAPERAPVDRPCLAGATEQSENGGDAAVHVGCILHLSDSEEGFASCFESPQRIFEASLEAHDRSS